MIAGKRPFAGATEVDTAKTILVDPAPKVDGPLADIIARALAKDPARRFSSAESMIAALSEAGPKQRGRARWIWIASTMATLVLGATALAAATMRPAPSAGAVSVEGGATPDAAEPGEEDAATVATEDDAAPASSGARTQAPRAPALRHRTRVAIGFGTQSGDLPAVVIADVVRQLKPPVTSCYETAGWSTRAEHTLVVAIHPDGTPISTVVRESRGGAVVSAVTSCVSAAFLRLRFRRWEGARGDHHFYIVIDPI
jgi:hypothetical protein